MNLTMPDEGRPETMPGADFAGVCRVCAQKVLAQIQRTKEAILADSAEALAAHRHLVQLALNEAEALAWETAYPHLVFLSLALEKVQALAKWDRHQRGVRRSSPKVAWAA